jgi:hypothetical protein
MRRTDLDVLAAVSIVSIALALGCAPGRSSTQTASDKRPASAQQSDEAVATDRAAAPSADPEPPPPPPSLPAGYLVFDEACEANDVVTIGAVGDVLLHHELQKQAFAEPERHLDLWSGIVDLLRQPDFTWANLEGPIARGIDRKGNEVEDPGPRYDNVVYTGYPRFNYHHWVAEDLRKSGVDLVSTSNNHAFDRYELGAERTIEALKKARLPFVGTRARGSKAPWHVVTEVGGLRLAWVACTLYTNFHKDKEGQILYCFQGNTVRDLVRKLDADEDIDAVVVTPHWGKEYLTEPGERQTEYARQWVEAGAVAIIGAHPHVLQPWERLETPNGRDAFVIHSLGNFVSHQRELPRRTTIMLYLGLGRRPDGKVAAVGARYVPLHVRMEGNMERFYVEAIDRAGGPEDARALVVDMYGPHNLMHPDEELDVRPHCDPAWPGWQPAEP